MIIQNTHLLKNYLVNFCKNDSVALHAFVDSLKKNHYNRDCWFLLRMQNVESWKEC